MFRVTPVILFILLFTLGLPSHSTACRRIGVTLPLTANLVAAGESFRNGILLAQEQFDPQHKVDFIFEDDAFTPRNTISAVHRLIDGEHVCALIMFGTPTAIAAGPLAEQSRIPTLVFSLFREVMVGKKFVMKHFVSAEDENEQVLQEAARRGYRRVAVAASSHEVMLHLKDLFMKSGGPEVVFSDEFSLQQDDFRSTVSRIIHSQVDAVYLLLFKNQSTFMKQLRRSGYTGQVFAAHNIEDPDEVADAAGLMDGIWYVNADDTGAAEWHAAYRTRFGTRPILGAMNGYDMAKLMIEGSNTWDLNGYLHSVKGFQGAFGTYDALPDRGFELPVTLKTIRGGVFQRLVQP